MLFIKKKHKNYGNPFIKLGEWKSPSPKTVNAIIFTLETYLISRTFI